MLASINRLKERAINKIANQNQEFRKDLSDAMMTRCQIMGNAQISAYDPAAVLALRGELKLTDEQVKDLEAIVLPDDEPLTAALLASLARRNRWGVSVTRNNPMINAAK